MSNWTFITNHGAVLALLVRHGHITAREIASQLGITERTVHRIVGDLEAAGYIQKSRAGRANRYAVSYTLPLRRPEMRDIAVDELLKVLLKGQWPPPSASGEQASRSGVGSLGRCAAPGMAPPGGGGRSSPELRWGG